MVGSILCFDLASEIAAVRAVIMLVVVILCGVTETEPKIYSLCQENYFINWPGNTMLHKAAITNSIDEARKLIDHNPERLARNGAGEIPLHLAAICGSVEVAALLLRQDGIKQRLANSKNGKIPMHRAVYYRQVNIVKLLLMNISDSALREQLTTLNTYFRSPLYYAAFPYRVHILKMCLREMVHRQKCANRTDFTKNIVDFNVANLPPRWSKVHRKRTEFARVVMKQIEAENSTKKCAYMLRSELVELKVEMRECELEKQNVTESLEQRNIQLVKVNNNVDEWRIKVATCNTSCKAQQKTMNTELVNARKAAKEWYEQAEGFKESSDEKLKAKHAELVEARNETKKWRETLEAYRQSVEKTLKTKNIELAETIEVADEWRRKAEKAKPNATKVETSEDGNKAKREGFNELEKLKNTALFVGIGGGILIFILLALILFLCCRISRDDGRISQ